MNISRYFKISYFNLRVLIKFIKDLRNYKLLFKLIDERI